MPQQKIVRAIYHDGTLQLLEPVNLPDGAEIQIALPMRDAAETGRAGASLSYTSTAPGDVRPGAGTARRGGGMR